MEINLSQWEDVEHFGEWLTGTRDNTRPEEGAEAQVTVSLWVPDVRISVVSKELVLLDRDTRRLAGWHLSYPDLEDFFRYPRDWRYVGPWLHILQVNPSERNVRPVPPRKGTLQIIRAEQGESLVVDLIAAGAVLQMIRDVPIALGYLRGVVRQTALWIKVRRRGVVTEEVSDVKVFTGNYQRQIIESGRLVRRTTIRLGDVHIEIEEFGEGG